MVPQKLPGNLPNNDRTNIGKSYELEVYGGKKGTAILYHHGIETERVDLSDTPAKRLFNIRLVERKVNQTKLSGKLNISRQTIHDYVERKEYFGLEGLINSYHASPNTSLKKQRKENLANRPSGNLSRKLEEIFRKARIEAQKVQESKPIQRNLSFTVDGGEKIKGISPEEQPFVEQHDWLDSRYAGVFVYIAHLFSQSKLLSLLSGYFGNGYKIFMVFILMAARNNLIKLKAKLADAKPVLNRDGFTRKNSTHSTLKKKISETEIQLEDMREKARKEPDRVKTSDLEDYREYKQVDNEGKKPFDFITSCVWNSRKDMVDLLRQHWNQENEIVDLFYAITECHGWVRSNKEEVRVRLEPLEQPRRRFAQEQLCR